MRSPWLSLLSRHSLVCQASKHQHSPASRFCSSAKFNQSRPQDALTERTLTALSSSDFEHLAGRGKFVDKSSALQDFLRGDMPVDLLLCPRRSGKTTLLSMFRAFFEFARPDKLAQRKDLFIKNNLAITKDVMFENEFGKYPVLYVDFSNVIGFTMASLLQNFRNHVTDTVLRLEDSDFFQNRGELPESRLASLEGVRKGMTPDWELPDILFKLTEIFHMLHQKEVVVLIDGYDTPTSYAAQYGYSHEANAFIRQVLTRLLKNNCHIRGALLVGILHVAKPSWVSGPNNILVFPLGQSRMYSTACMFTEDETRTLYDRQVEIQKLPFEFDDLKKWYDGYSTHNGPNLYNPWSVANALATGILTTWWKQPGSDPTLEARVIELLGSDRGFRAQYQTLLNGGEIDIAICDLEYTAVPNMSSQQLWTLMYYAGYLTSSDDTSYYSRSFVRIPNAEIRSHFRGWIQKDFHSRMTPELSGTSLGQFNFMINGYFAEFAESFGNFFFKNAPQCIFGGLEAVYQEFLYVYFSSAASALEVRPEWTTVKMEVDLGTMVFYRKHGVVIKVKYFPHDKKEGYGDQERKLLSNGTKEALKPCHNTRRRYLSMMPEHVNTIYEYGLAFLGPYCGVETQILKRENETWVTVNDSVYTADEDEKRRQRTYCIDAITGRNLFAKFYLERHAPTVAEFADVWKNLDHETVETWQTKAQQMKKTHKEKEKKKKVCKESGD